MDNYSSYNNYHFEDLCRSLKNCTNFTICICRWSRPTPSLQNNIPQSTICPAMINSIATLTLLRSALKASSNSAFDWS